MPPRYAYWTILVDGQPTAFRSGAQEDLLPTFNRLKEKNPSAMMMWFQNGKLWNSRVDAQEAMRVRGERGREGDRRQDGRPKAGGFRDRDRKPARPERKPEWKPKGEYAPAEDRAPRRSARREGEALDWKPKGEFTPAPRRSNERDFTPKEERDWKPKPAFGDRDRKPAWKPKGSFDRESKPEWKSKGSFDRGRKPEWKSKSSFDRERKPEWKSKGSFDRERKPDWKPTSSGDRERKPERRRTETLDWKPKSSPGSREKRKWVPKEEYKRSQGIEARRDKNWRPGGEHKDPRQKYKDAKKAKWTRFKQTIRTRWEKKQGKKNEE
jgi:hypothetical protein